MARFKFNLTTTHLVWCRYSNDGRTSPWFDDPKQYRSERSADQAILDLNKVYGDTHEFRKTKVNEKP